MILSILLPEWKAGLLSLSSFHLSLTGIAVVPPKAFNIFYHKPPRMRKCTFYILSFFLLHPVLFYSQSLTAIDTGKYRINLPAHFKPGNKAWRILDEKLPLVCEELKNKELCGDNCNPAYTIDFIMSDPVVLDYYAQRISGTNYDIITLYTFESSLLLKNSAGKIVTRIILVDTNDVFKITNKASIAEFLVPPPPNKISLQKNASGQPEVVVAANLNSPPTTSVFRSDGSYGGIETPYSYINKNKQKLAPKRKRPTRSYRSSYCSS